MNKDAEDLTRSYLASKIRVASAIQRPLSSLLKYNSAEYFFAYSRQDLYAIIKYRFINITAVFLKLPVLHENELRCLNT